MVSARDASETISPYTLVSKTVKPYEELYISRMNLVEKLYILRMNLVEELYILRMNLVEEFYVSQPSQLLQHRAVQYEHLHDCWQRTTAIKPQLQTYTHHSYQLN